MNIIWKPCLPDSRYLVSNTGNIKSPRGTMLKQHATGGNYLNINLGGRGSATRYAVHVLVAQAFIPNPDNKPYVNHIDGNKQNNLVTNLEWVTDTENKIHAYRHKLMPSGEARSETFITEEDVRFIRTNCRRNGGQYTYEELAKMFGFSRGQTISNIVNGRNWVHVK